MKERVRLDIDALAEADEGEGFAGIAGTLHRISVEERSRRRRRFFTALAVVAISLMVAALGALAARRSLARSTAQRAYAAYERAAYYNHNRRHAEALQEINAAIGTLPGEADFYIERGEALLGLGETRHVEARRNFERARELDPQNVRACSKLGWWYAAEKQFAESRRYFDRALTLAGRDERARALVLCDRGWALLWEYDQRRMQGESDAAICPLLAEAVVCLEEARDLLKGRNDKDPKLADVYNNLAWAANLSGDTAAAIEYGKKAIELVPTFGWAYNSLGDAFVTSNQLEAALNFYSKGIAVDPINGQIYCNRSKLYARLGKGELAERDRKAAETLGFRCE
jgi:tetratricopeptide (TPR) repeat protein